MSRIFGRTGQNVEFEPGSVRTLSDSVGFGQKTSRTLEDMSVSGDSRWCLDANTDKTLSSLRRAPTY